MPLTLSPSKRSLNGFPLPLRKQHQCERSAQGLSRVRPARLGANLLWGLLGQLLYHSICEGVAGTSLGKLMLGYRVITEERRPCTPGAAILRSLGYFVDALFFGLPAYSYMSKSDLHQRIGDRWGKTIVAKARSLPDTARRSSGLVAVGLLGGMIAQGLAVILSLVAKVL